MQLSEFLDFDAIKPSLSGGNKRALLQQLAQFAAAAAADSMRQKSCRASRSASGWARPGSARASPSRTARSRDSTASTACSCALSEPVDYKSIDGQPVDLVFLLLSPPDAGAEHLKALAAISRVTRHAPTLEKMRGARSRDALAAVLMGADERDAA